MNLRIAPTGDVRCIYGEDIDLARLGQLNIQRASHVESTGTGWWTADLSPVNGPVLGPFPQRSDAIQAELDWLNLYHT